MIFASSRTVPYIDIALVYGAMRWAYAMPLCVLFVSSRSGVVSNPSAGAIADDRQSAKDIDLYFKSQLYVEDLGH